MLHPLFVSFTVPKPTSHDRFMPPLRSLRSRLWALPIPRRLPPRMVGPLLAQAQVAVPPQQAAPSQMALSQPSRSLLPVCWLPLVLPLACSELPRERVASCMRVTISASHMFYVFLILAPESVDPVHRSRLSLDPGHLLFLAFLAYLVCGIRVLSLDHCILSVRF